MKFHFILIGLLIFCGLFSKANESKKRLYESYWNTITLAKNGDSIVVSDSMSVLYSIRKFDANQQKFLSEDIDPDGKITIVLAVCKNAKWTAYLQKNLDEACAFLPKHKSYLFYIDGYGKNFPLSMFRSAGLANTYQTNVVVFDYPSYHSDYGVFKNYKWIKKTAKKSALPLSVFLKKVETSEFVKIDWLFTSYNVLFFHSMGNILLKEMVQKNLYQNSQSGFYKRLVLNNPCVSSYHHEKWIDKISFANEIFIHHNPLDKILKGAVLMEAKPILGRYRGKTKSNKAIYINFKQLVGKEHNAFYNKPNLPKILNQSFDYYTALFQGKSFPFTWMLNLKNSKSERQFILIK